MKKSGLRDVIALTLAIILWFYVKVTTKGVTSQIQMQISVPIERKGVSSTLTVYHVSHNQATVTVQGDTQEVSSLREQQVSALIDLTGEEASTAYLKVKVIVPGQVKLISVDPETVQVQQAPIISKQVPFKVIVSGPTARGRTASKVSFTPTEARVSGPEPMVKDVAEVRGRILLTGQSQSSSFELRDLVPVKWDGTPVEAGLARIKVVPSVILASVPILDESHSVAVAVSLENVRAEKREGWRSSLEVEPAFVTLSLSKDQQAPDYVVTRPEFFSASSKVESRDVPLEIPDGFEVIGNRSVKVRIVPTRLARPVSPSPSQTPFPFPLPTPLPQTRPNPSPTP